MVSQKARAALLSVTFAACFFRSAAWAQHSHEHSAGASSVGWPGHLLQLYVPRSVCMYHETWLIALHGVSDLLIAAAYFTIPVALIWLVQQRRDLAFNWMFRCFAFFIVACGGTHLFGVLDLWYPFYWLDGMLKAFTALASVITAVLLWRLLPLAVRLPSPAQLEALNTQLQEEIRQKSLAEESIRELHALQEQVIADRTDQLRRANQELEQEIAVRKLAEQQREVLLEAEQAARREAERASQIKDEFLATLSHELRTPLNAILGWTTILQMGAEAVDLSTGLEVIQRNTHVQVRLVDDLLDMNRILSGKMRLDVQSLNLMNVIEAALQAVQPAADAKRLRLQPVLDPNAAEVTGDPARVQQIAWNLLMNAIKFTPAEGRITVVLSRVNSHVEMSVTDTGEGISPEFLPLVFDRFRQADASITRRHGGLGLGLSIVRHLVELHGGSVRVSSPGLGKGSTFVVCLPLRAVSAGDQRTPSSAADVRAGLRALEIPRLEGATILVVDDEKDAREMVGHLLRLKGADVVLAGSAKEALEMVGHRVPSLIVSDIGMPGEDGYSLIKRLRALPSQSGGDTPAIALTAFARPEDRRLALLSGFQMHVAKPVDADELQTVVATVLGLRSQPAASS